MISRDIDTEKLRLAQIKYFDKEHNGIELSSIDAYAFLYEVNGHYVNPFDVFAELPVYQRVPYSNVTKSGMEYGTKIKHVQGEVQDGACYVIGFDKMQELFGKDSIDTVELRDYIVRSTKFFVDRLPMVASMMSSANRKERERYKKIINSDNEQLESFIEYMSSHEKGYQYNKGNK